LKCLGYTYLPIAYCLHHIYLIVTYYLNHVYLRVAYCLDYTYLLVVYAKLFKLSLLYVYSTLIILFKLIFIIIIYNS